eukprot:1160943-Pelagomonas_calceolata.AAC.3
MWKLLESVLEDTVQGHRLRIWTRLESLLEDTVQGHRLRMMEVPGECVGGHCPEAQITDDGSSWRVCWRTLSRGTDYG